MPPRFDRLFWAVLMHTVVCLSVGSAVEALGHSDWPWFWEWFVPLLAIASGVMVLAVARRPPPKYQATIVGLYSGLVSSIPFVTFATEAHARRWVDEMNGKHPSDQTRYDFREIG